MKPQRFGAFVQKVPGHIKQVRGAHVPSDDAGRSGAAGQGQGQTITVPAQTALASPERREAESAPVEAAADERTGKQVIYGSPVVKEAQRAAKFEKILSADVVDLKALRDASWSGVPAQHRMVTWQLLLGYLPANREWQDSTLERKRREYRDSVPQYFDVDDSERSEYQRAILHQVRRGKRARACVDRRELRCLSPPPVDFAGRAADVLEQSVLPARIGATRPRTHPLYLGASPPGERLRAGAHPSADRAPSYHGPCSLRRATLPSLLQGINDLVLPFYVVFLQNCTTLSGSELPQIDDVPTQKLAEVEADCYWCLSKLLDVIQDHYTFAQPGIQRMVFRLREIVQRIDKPLHAHLHAQGVQFIQFAFRWMNCLLTRELSLPLITRMWDTYLAEGGAVLDASSSTSTKGAVGDNFVVLHVYVCAALLLRWSDKLKEMPFQEVIMFLQHLPTADWGVDEVEEMLSQAYLWKQLYNDSHAHLQSELPGE